MQVMKFGGSTVGEAEGMKRAAEIIRSGMGGNIVAVVSAIGKTTGNLLKCYNELVSKRISEAFTGLNRIEEKHILIASRLIYDINKFYDVNLKLYKLFDEVRSIFTTIACEGGNDSFKAKVLSYGEMFSTTILSAYFDHLYIKNKLLDAKEIIVTDSNYLKAAPDFDSIKEKADSLIKPVLESGSIVVIQGFIGSDKENETTLLGFEGSDFTASILGNVLDAEKITIWTDVDGVLTADPKIIEDAVTISKLSYDEAAMLAYYGAKVLHPFTTSPASEKGIPIFIKNYNSGSGEGTCIDSRCDLKHSNVKSITFKENIKLVEIKSSPGLQGLNGTAHKTFDIHNKENNTIHQIQKSGNKLFFVIEDPGINNGKYIDYNDNMKSRSLITLVGKNIGKDRKIRNRVSLRKNQFNAEVFPSESPDNICLIVEKKECFNMLKELHKEFITDNPAIHRDSALPEHRYKNVL
jgi:aspartate kinase